MAYTKTTLLAGLLLAPVFACYGGTTYYVTAEGHASNDGLSWETAWISEKVSTSVAPGDTVLVRKGEYPNWNSLLDISIAGTEAEPITIKGELTDDPPTISRTSCGRRCLSWNRLAPKRGRL
jgi:hypothetical protein